MVDHLRPGVYPVTVDRTPHTRTASADSSATRIADTLDRMATADPTEAAQSLLEVLGYRSDRTLPGQTGEVGQFISSFPAPTPDTDSERELRSEASDIRVLFQVTGDEIANLQSLFDSPPSTFEQANARSFIFAAVQLQAGTYSRSRYAQFTREINKRLSQPTVIFFTTTDALLTLAFVHRRPHKRDHERDVLGSVSLVREIDPTHPHRAHLDILEDLSLANRAHWIKKRNKPLDFDNLLEAWLEALDTEELNRRFYRELFDWFTRATEQARFPTAESRTYAPEEHVIRLITRLLFIWFIKEKHLIAEDLFDEERIRPLIRDYDRDTGDSYYRVVLQNLFFATLNTELDRRDFSKVSRTTHRDFSLYRHRREMADPDKLRALFDLTPFINGGLFDCLDSEASTTHDGYRVDCFSDNPRHRALLSVPNCLFFGPDGLIDLFNRYRFTVEENTPVEQEVALDPELLGKVFENLLAAYNPETRGTARKQTGSYYTPRKVVDYMVEETLISFFADNLQPQDHDIDYWKERLRYLLDYADVFDDAEELFEPAERESIIETVATVKILDPAVGSGAFPMAVLHRLTLILRRLDPDNLEWERVQKHRAGERAAVAFETHDQQACDSELIEIGESFEKYRDSDFGRKLYLIQNSIFGVDIQPIACQIAKLRFFIALAIEQHPDPEASNFGIRPLPNLETRFVAADSLIGLEGPQRLANGQAVDIQKALQVNREQHFHATTRQRKLELSKEDRRLRSALADELQTVGMPPDTAEAIAAWNPYDQNSAAGWFEAKYMFGVTSGFDIVIGNPPYIESRSSLLSKSKKDSYVSQVRYDWGDSLPRGSDVLIYFYARSAKLLAGSGCGCFITQNSWLSTDYGKKFQEFITGRFSFRMIVDSSVKFFPDLVSQNVNTIITLFSKQTTEDFLFGVADEQMRIRSPKTIPSKHRMKWGHIIAMPSFFYEILTGLNQQSSDKHPITIGQGLNFPKKELNQHDASIPVIVNQPAFAATEADAHIAYVPPSRQDKIPALIMPRGVGNRYYCSFNACRAYSYSHVEIYLPPSAWNQDIHYALWAYMNSSFAWLYREITGRKNLGGGLLKAEAADLKLIPLGLDFNFARQARAALETLRARQPLPVQEEINTEEHLLIDKIVSTGLGFRQHEEKIREALIEQVDFRLRRSRHRSS